MQAVRVYWNQETLWDKDSKDFFRPGFVVDGTIGDSARTFRTNANGSDHM